MPELPEVETIRRVLAARVTGRVIQTAAYGHPKLLRGQSGRFFRAGLIGREILQVARRAKYLLLRLDRNILLLHLGMTGQVIVAPKKPGACRDLPQPPDKHTHLTLGLSGGLNLFFRDPRRFGRMQVLDPSQEEKYFHAFGPEPLSAGFTSRVLHAALHGRRAPLKAILLNQKVVAGLGNIYVDESLFRARLSPLMPGIQITPARAQRLHAAIRSVLRAAIRHRGTSISDYRDPDARPGGFQLRLRVYGREGEPCPVCGTRIRKAVVVQRGTHWCPKCQP